jgi:hypothetical protein
MHPPFAAFARRFFGRSALALLLAFAACGDGGDRVTPGDSSPGGVNQQTGTPSPAPSAAASTGIELRVGGGQFAGTHQVTDNVTCTVDPGTWMVSSSRPGDQGVTQVLLLLEGVQPAGGSSQDVSLMVHFGDPMGGTSTNSGSISIDPAGGEGTGSGTVRRDGRGAVIEVDGTTSDGARVSAVTRCASVAGTQ